MCGGCGGAPASWADAVLSRAHARPIVARLASALLSRRARVRGTPGGWTVARIGSGAVLVCRTSDELAHALAGLIVDVASVEAQAAASSLDCCRASGDLFERILAALLTEEAHRPIALSRHDVPTGSVDAAMPGEFDPSEAASSENLIPHVLARVLARAAGATAPPLLLRDAEGLWRLAPR